MSKKNYYEILKVSPLASEPAIKKSYQNLVRTHHPDKNPSLPEAHHLFKEINEAYAVLSDPFKRKDYDRRLQKQKEEAQKNRPPPRPMYDSFHTHQSFADSPGLKQTLKPLSLSLSLEEAFTGCRKQLLVSKNRKGWVDIPPGACEGQRLKVQPLKSPGSGNLFVELSYKKHLLFQKQGLDIVMDLPVPLNTAVLGGSVKIPTLTGLVTCRLPGGVRAGYVEKIKNQGFVSPDKKRGNMLVRVLVDLPPLSREDKAWIQKWNQKNRLYPEYETFKVKVHQLLKSRGPGP